MPPRHRMALGIATAIPLAAIVFAFSLGPSPEKKLARMYDVPLSEAAPQTHGERSSRSIVPLVIDEVAKKDNMPRRKRAIRFLGEAKERLALPVLENILGDEAERDDMRADALRAITTIDPHRGRELASLHRTSAGLLGTSAKEITDL